MKLSEAFARKTYGPRKMGEKQLHKAKKEFAPKLEQYVLASLREIWLDLYDKGDHEQRWGDWLHTLVQEGELSDVIVDFLDFRHEAEEIAKSISADIMGAEQH